MKPIEKLTKKERLALYKRALECYLTKNFPSQLEGAGICMLLPCLYWDLNHFCDKSPDGVDWDYRDTKKWFPEIKEWLAVYNSYSTKEQGSIQRIDYLKWLIEEMSSTSKNPK